MTEQPPQEFSNILEFSEAFEKELKLQHERERQTLFEKNQELLEKVNKLEADNTHLRELLVATIPHLKAVNNVEKIEKTAHETICELQIELLLNKASQQELNLEEVKRLDLLVKNLYANKKQADNPIPVEASKIQLPLPKQDIRKLAERKVEDDVSRDT